MMLSHPRVASLASPLSGAGGFHGRILCRARAAGAGLPDHGHRRAGEIRRARRAIAPGRDEACSARTRARRARTCCVGAAGAGGNASATDAAADIRADGRAHCAGAGRAERTRAGNRRIRARSGGSRGTRHELRGASRHAMGGLGRRPCARARRHLSRTLLDRAGPARTARADRARRTAGGRAHRRGRMGAPDRAARRPLRPADRAHPEHPDRRRHHRRLCRRLRRPCALRVSRPRLGFHPARPGGAGDACRRAAAWAGAGGPRPRRRLCHAASRRLAAAGLLVALRLSGGGDRRRVRARALPDVALARHHRGRLQHAVDLARHRRRRRRRARRACLPRHRRICARRIVDRRGPVVRTGCAARPHRRRVIGGARRLPACSDPAGAGEPARSACACNLRRARSGDGGDRLACGSGDRGSAGGGRAGRARVRALGGRSRYRAPGHAVRSGRRCGAGAAEDECRVASGAGSRLRAAVRRRRLSGAGALRAGARACPVERGSGVRADRDSRRAVLPHRRVRAFDSIRGGGVAAERALCVRDRDAGQARAAAGTSRGERDIRDRRGCRACARADIGAGARLAHGRARADGAGDRLGCGPAAAAGAARACRRDRRAGAGAHRLGAAHRRRRRGHETDLQLAALRLRHSRRGVLAGRLSSAPPRRRRARAHGGCRRHPADRAAGLPGNPPLHQWRRRLPGRLEPGRDRAAGLRRARHDHRARAVASALPQRGPRRRRTGDRGADAGSHHASGSA